MLLNLAAQIQVQVHFGKHKKCTFVWAAELNCDPQLIHVHCNEISFFII